MPEFRCRALARWLIAVLFCTTAASAVVQSEPAFKVAPRPSWLQRVEFPTSFEVPLGQVSGGSYYLLADRQLRYAGSGLESFAHFAVKALDASGVENLANLEIVFDPTYERLTIHRVAVLRAGEWIDKLATASVRTLQREEDLEYRLFDGAVTVSIVLDDVRVGDIVEHAFTVTGSNPVFGDARFGRMDLQWSSPVHRQFARLVVPKGTRVRIEPEASAIRAAVTERGDLREYVVDRTGVAPLVVESDAPAWYDPYPRLSWTSYADWGAVSRWAEPLYRVAKRPDSSLSVEIERIRREAQSQPARLLEALRFVQREVRYLGVEIGAGSHAPSDPAVVLQRRFGDCKDKALLLVTMLQALGIDAWPALVSTTRDALDARLPSPFAFDHVIVHVRMGDQRHWLDPTRPEQLADLARLFQPDFGSALVVDAPTKALVTMEREQPVGRREIRAVIDATGAYIEPAKLTVVTTSERGGAEAVRSDLSASSLEEMGTRYLNYYAAWYPGLRSLGPIVVKDDPLANRIELTERYQIADFWKRSEVNKRTEAQVDSPDILELLQVPGERIRQAPLRLSHPVNVQLTTEVKLPDSWPVKDETITVEDPHFRYQRTIRGGKTRHIVIVDQYQSLADHVAAADAEQFAGNVEKARASAGQLFYTSHTTATDAQPAVASMNWLVAMLAALVGVFTAWLAVRLYRWDPVPAAGRPTPSLAGIRGWLLLPAFATLVTPLGLCAVMWSTVGSYSAETWASLTAPTSDAYHALWAPLLLFELVANITQLGLALLVAVLYFKRRSSVPRLYIAMMAYMVVVQAVDIALALRLERDAGVEIDVKASDWIRSALPTVIWVAYFLRSERVRSTFTRQLSAPTGGREPAPEPDISGFPSARQIAR
jgi:transglutaminase-like putative cysteine protease